MSDKIGKPWYKKPAIVIHAIVVILATIIGAGPHRVFCGVLG